VNTTRRFAVIGGGPAGLFAAHHAAKEASAAQVILYERNSRAGRKLLATGSGQCNITRNASVEHMLLHYGNNGRFLSHALHSLTPHMTMGLFEAMGLPLVVRDDDKVFPASFKASNVLEILLSQCKTSGVSIIGNQRITEVRYTNGETFELYAGETRIDEVAALVVATGGMSYPRTGSTGDGYALAKSLGHHIVPARPALCGVSIDDKSLSVCSGITLDRVVLTLPDGKTASGPLLITHTGLSGPVVLDTSRYLNTGDEIEICWLPDERGRKRSAKVIEDELLRLCNSIGNGQLSTAVHRMGLPMKLSQWLIATVGIDGTRKAAETGRKTLAPLARLISEQRFTISLKGAFAEAMVTSGGVDLRELDPKTMESRIVKGLYFAGEVLDIDGDTGGYNLQAAWSTGALAGSSMVRDFT
jgi:predicted Rossmann fold flavoprotein